MPRESTLNRQSPERLPILRGWALSLLFFSALWSGAAFAGADLDKKTSSTTAGHYDRNPPGPSVVTSNLDEILGELILPPKAALSMWDQIRAWLEEFIGDRQQSSIPRWLEDFRLSASTAQWIFYIACALIVLLSGAIIYNELRHVSAKRRATRQLPTNAQSNPSGLESVTTDAAELSLFDLPAYLLKMLIARLGTGLADARPDSMTHRELVQAASAMTASRRQPFVRVASVAEHIRYAPQPPDDREIELAVAGARELIDELDTSS